ncbi:MAG: insulinase family protein [Planctomycetes bacterium]|nr:insulinase family protein [Planctomycetota bacterium]
MNTDNSKHLSLVPWLLCLTACILLLASCEKVVVKHRPLPERVTDNKIAIQRVAHPDQLTFPPLEVVIPQPERYQLKNGITVYLLENRELPLVDVSVLVHSGSIYEPISKSGLANLTATLMRTGGTAKYPPQELDKVLEFKSMRLSVSADYEEIKAELSVLSRDTQEGLEILGEVLFAPAFNEEKLADAKKRQTAMLNRENDEPGAIASRRFRQLLYPEHPYGERVTGNSETVPTISRVDIIEFHSNYFRPEQMMLAVSGDFRRHEMRELLEKTLGGAAKSKEQIANGLNPQSPIRNPQSRLVLIQKDIPQATIMVGQPGIHRLNPDYFTVMLMNAILGGGPLSRLYQDIREKNGLAYDVYSGWAMPISAAMRPGDANAPTGLFIIGTETRTDAVHKALEIIIKQVGKIRDEYVAEQELANTKESIINAFVFRFEKPLRVVEQMMYREYIGLPADYLQTYRQNILKATKDDIRRAAQKYLSPDNFTIVVVGDVKNFNPAVRTILPGVTPIEESNYEAPLPEHHR